MNKRIKELAEQCWKERPADQLHFDTEKFAELIVRECAKEAFEFWVYQVDSNDESAQSHIKKHFGIEK